MDPIKALEQWKTGILICDPTCCLACCFPFAVFGYNVHLVQTVLESKSLPQCPICPEIVPVCAGFLYFAGLTVGSAFGSTVTPGLGLLSCFSVALHAYVRNVIRKHHDLNNFLCNVPCYSNPCYDCCLAFICYSCAMAQEQRELNMIEGGSKPKPPYTKNKMDMPPIKEKEVRTV